MILGIDLGNINVKTSTGVLFENRLTKDERLYEDTEEIKVEYEQEKYILGIGEYQTNYIKSQKKDTLLTLFSAISLSTADNFNQIVVGLPIQQYRNDKNNFEEQIIHNRIKDIKVNNKSRRIIITDVKIFPEGLATYYSLGNETRQQIGNRDIVIIDVGGRTTDICLYSMVANKRKLLNYVTIPAGTLNIYSDFINAINDAYGLGKLKEEAPQILSQGLWVDGEKVQLKFTKPIFEKYIERILGELRLNYPIRTAQCILCGGGGQLLKHLFTREIKGLIVIEDIFCNAKGFSKVGESLWA